MVSSPECCLTHEGEMFDDDRLPRYLLHCLPLVMLDLSCHITYWAVIIFLAKLLQQQKCTKTAISCYAESHIPCLTFLFRQGLKSPWYPRNLVWAELSCEGKVMFGKVRKERNLSVKEMLCLEKLIELCRAKDRHSDQHLHRHDLADIMMEWGRRESEINAIYIDDGQELMCVLFLAGAKKHQASLVHWTSLRVFSNFLPFLGGQ